MQYPLHDLLGQEEELVEETLATKKTITGFIQNNDFLQHLFTVYAKIQEASKLKRKMEQDFCLGNQTKAPPRL